MENEIIISIENLSKSFNKIPVLSQISFQVRKGDLSILVGENGAGKSTLINILMGLEVAENGSGKILGLSLSEDLFPIKDRIGLVSEKIDYHLPISIMDFMKHYARFYKSWDNDYFNQLISKRKIDTELPYAQYSRGQKMQMALIAALSSRPQILLIDEVTSVLDINARKFFMDILKQFTQDGGTVLMATNIINEVEYITDHIIFLNRGKVELDDRICNIPSRFVKLRCPEGVDHPIFNDQDCLWNGINSDRSISYLVPYDTFKRYQISTELVDKHEIALDEIFLYYIRTGNIDHD